MGPFNSEMLVLARESRDVTQKELAIDTETSQAEVSKFETGQLVPTIDRVERFSRRLRYPNEFFYAGEAIRSFGSSCVYHRKRQSTPDGILRRLLALINIRRIQIRRLLLSTELSTANRFHRLDIEDHGGDVERIAQMVRVSWSMPPGPVTNLIRAIEDAGGIVIRCDLGTDKVDALSQWSPSMPPVFLVNSSIPMDRLRFTLAHEIGHIVMHQLPTENMEKEADRFASEFLMPAAAIRPQLLEVTLPKLAALKPYWRVSMNALLKRAGDLETISPRKKSWLWTQMGKAGYRTMEPVTIAPEEPTLVPELVELHKTQLGYTTQDLERLLYTSDEELREVFLPSNKRFRLVR